MRLTWARSSLFENCYSLFKNKRTASLSLLSRQVCRWELCAACCWSAPWTGSRTGTKLKDLIDLLYISCLRDQESRPAVRDRESRTYVIKSALVTYVTPSKQKKTTKTKKKPTFFWLPLIIGLQKIWIAPAKSGLARLNRTGVNRAQTVTGGRQATLGPTGPRKEQRVQCGNHDKEFDLPCSLELLSAVSPPRLTEVVLKRGGIHQSWNEVCKTLNGPAQGGGISPHSLPCRSPSPSVPPPTLPLANYAARRWWQTRRWRTRRWRWLQRRRLRRHWRW